MFPFFYFPLNVVIVFSNPVPKDFMISDANSNRSGSAVFQSQSPRT
jgi:hypothetical protein